MNLVRFGGLAHTARPMRSRRPPASVVLLLGMLALAGPARAQTVDPTLWSTDGTVKAMALSGGTLYIGGTFSYVGPITGDFVGIDSTTGRPQSGWPRVEGGVYASVPDGVGGWYIGGVFRSVAGVPRTFLAHIRANGTLDGWNPGANNIVKALALSGSTVYAGGSFTSIGGQPRSHIAALDAATGLATSWNPGANGDVSAFAVSGSTVYAGGGFTSIGGQARSAIAALDAATGVATAWNPAADRSGYESSVNALAVSGSTVYAGGVFSSIGGQPRLYFAALDSATGLATAWNPGADFVVSALAVSGSTVYAGGSFTSIGGQPRFRIAALDAATGLATAWNPSAGGNVYTLAVSGSTVYAGGFFSSIGGQPRSCVAALDVGIGLATDWNPWATGAGLPIPRTVVNALAVSGSTVYAGGDFGSIGGQTRSHIAALDAGTGLATAWNPGANGTVYALAVSGSTVYVGGGFGIIGGQPRSGIAALDSTTGLVTTWNPGGSGGLQALAVSGSTVYVGGGFTSIGGQPRSRIAALDIATGLATAWNPGADDWVYALAVSGSTVYAGGWFSNIGGQPRYYIAALDAATGLATGWDPEPDFFVYALALGDSTVYAGGSFSYIGGQVRRAVAALDPATGFATDWNPQGRGTVAALTVSGSTVYAGGNFSHIGLNADVARILPVPVSAPLATVLSPNGGEITYIGATSRLTWSATASAPGVESVDLYLSRPGAAGPWELLAAGAPNTGAYDCVLTAPASVGTCYLRVDARDYAGILTSDISDAGFTISDGALGVDPAASGTAFSLGPMAPNPVPGRSRLSYVVPRSAHVRLTLLDVQGRELVVLADGGREAGRYTLSLDARALRPGLHFVRLQAPSTDLKQRVVILR